MVAQKQMQKTLGNMRAVIAGMLCAGLVVIGASAKAAENEWDSATQTLFDAVHANDLNGAQTSVVAGADLDAKDRWGLTAIDLAIDKGYYNIAHFLASSRNFRRDDRRALTSDNTDVRGTESPGARTRAGSSVDVGANDAAHRGIRNTRRARDVAPQADNSLNAEIGAVSLPEWPSDQPNPFDPEGPAAGSTFIVLDEVGTVGAVPELQKSVE